LFGFCLALGAYSMLAVAMAALRSVPGAESIDQDLTLYYVANDIAQTYHGMMMAIPEDEWRVFSRMRPAEMVAILKELAQKVCLTAYRKSARGPKKPRRNVLPIGHKAISHKDSPSSWCRSWTAPHSPLGRRRMASHAALARLPGFLAPCHALVRDRTAPLHARLEAWPWQTLGPLSPGRALDHRRPRPGQGPKPPHRAIGLDWRGEGGAYRRWLGGSSGRPTAPGGAATASASPSWRARDPV